MIGKIMKENNNQDGERSFVSTLYYAVAIGQAERAAKVMSQVETGVFMIMSSYFLSSEFENRNALNIITGMLSGQGKETLYNDLRENGVEATREQVDNAIVNVLSFMIESGMATLSIALQDSGNKFTLPPGKQSFNIEDLGIENPFKKNDES
jgi:hypothetical protein